MAQTQRQPQRSERRKRPFILLLLSLFPLLAVVGVLAPGLVHVKAEEEQDAGQFEGRVSRRISRFAHQPLLLPRDFSAGFIPELLDLEHLFSRVDYLADPKARERARIPSFPREFGDVIVLDDLDARVRQIVFHDPIVGGQQLASAFPPPSEDLLPLPGPYLPGPDPRFDDIFEPEPDVDETVIPEPETALLLGLGLGLLGFLGYRRF